MTTSNGRLRRSFAIAPLVIVITAFGAYAVDVPVSYTVDSPTLRDATAGTMLTFELHEDDTCTGAVHSESIPIEAVNLIERPRTFKIKSGPTPPKPAVLNHLLSGAPEASAYYLQVSGTGVSPINGACQLQRAGGGAGASSGGGVEIDQSRALAGGVTASDAAGFPVTIDTEGSYRLIGSLDVPDANTTGIEIVADHVTLDLGGFEIACKTCGPSPSGSGDGINADGRNGIAIVNGTIRDVGHNGVTAFDGAIPGIGYEVRNLRVQSVGGVGIVVQDASRIADNVVVSAGGSGISASSGSVRNNVVRHAGLDGVVCFNACVIEGNSAHESGRDGISCANSCVVVENVAVTNGRDGIRASASMVANNVARNSTDDGLDLGTNTAAIGNTVVNSDDDGLVGSPSSTTPVGYVFNSIHGSGGSDVAPFALEMGDNVCDADLTCP
jgi:hypothetical protein